MWNYLAAWRYFEKQGESEEEVKASIKTLYKNVVALDSGARGATTSFVENGQGDVLIAWENEAFLSLREYPGKYEIVVPSVSILCQPTVAVVDAVARSTVRKRSQRSTCKPSILPPLNDLSSRISIDPTIPRRTPSSSTRVRKIRLPRFLRTESGSTTRSKGSISIILAAGKLLVKSASSTAESSILSMKGNPSGIDRFN